jgi:hypothetical protein
MVIAGGTCLTENSDFYSLQLGKYFESILKRTSKRTSMATKYGSKASEKVERAMHERRHVKAQPL